MQQVFLSNKEWRKFLNFLLEEGEVWGLKESKFVPDPNKTLHLTRMEPGKLDGLVIGRIRPSESVKTIFSPIKEDVGSPKERDKVILLGAKACDLNSLAIQDFVFKEGEFKDPFYIERRERTVIISSDCTCYGETCFCLAVGREPYPVRFFDLNLCEQLGGYVVEIGSEKGEELLKRSGVETIGVSPDRRKEQKEKREKLVKDLREHIEKGGFHFNEKSLKGAVQKNYESEVWHREAERCVECGACNFACPTCHCFFLSEKGKESLSKIRNWDACLYNRFARVAGGANPRGVLYQRLRNRFEKKFDYFPRVMGEYACTGCGRCYEGCLGDIDIRVILEDIT